MTKYIAIKFLPEIFGNDLSYLAHKSASAEASILTANKAAFAAFPIATVATGIPFGIYKVEKKEKTYCNSIYLIF